MSIRQGWKGVLLYATQASQGTPSTPNLPVGWWSNLAFNKRGAIEGIRSAGSRSVVEFEGRTLSTELRFTIDKVQLVGGKTLLQKAIDASGDLPWLTFGVSDGDSSNDQQVQDCRIDRLEVNVEPDNWVQATLNLIGGKTTSAGPYTQTFLDTPGVSAKEATWSLFEIVGWRLSYSNNLKVQAVIAGPSTSRDPDRIWDYLEVGQENIELALRIANPSGIDVYANVISSWASPTLTLESFDTSYSSDTIVFTFTDLTPTDENLTIPGSDGDIIYEVPCSAKGLTIT